MEDPDPAISEPPAGNPSIKSRNPLDSLTQPPSLSTASVALPINVTPEEAHVLYETAAKTTLNKARKAILVTICALRLAKGTHSGKSEEDFKKQYSVPQLRSMIDTAVRTHVHAASLILILSHSSRDEMKEFLMKMGRSDPQKANPLRLARNLKENAQLFLVATSLPKFVVIWWKQRSHHGLLVRPAILVSVNGGNSQQTNGAHSVLSIFPSL